MMQLLQLRYKIIKAYIVYETFFHKGEFNKPIR